MHWILRETFPDWDKYQSEKYLLDFTISTGPLYLGPLFLAGNKKVGNNKLYAIAMYHYPASKGIAETFGLFETSLQSACQPISCRASANLSL